MKESAVIKKRKKAVSPVIVVIYVFLVLLAVLYLAPLLWMLSVSLKDNAGVMAAPFALPETFHLENYTQAWSLGKLGTALVNSTLVCGVTLLVSLFFGAMAAFAIARMESGRGSAYIFPDWNDGAGTLYPDSSVCPFCEAWADQLQIRPDASIHHVFPSDDDLPSDRIF